MGEEEGDDRRAQDMEEKGYVTIWAKRRAMERCGFQFLGRARYKNWPWRLLRPGYVDSDNFMKAHKCCLDAWFSEPFRSTMRSRDDLETSTCKALLKNLGRKHLKVRGLVSTSYPHLCPFQFPLLPHSLSSPSACGQATNMGLECLLSEIKASRLGGTGSSNSERVIYHSHLRDLMKRHLASGGLDSRRLEKRSEMAAEGVPVVRMPVGSGGVEEMADAGGKPEDSGSWSCGDCEWPVRGDVIDGYLAMIPGVSDHSRHYGGYASKGGTARKQAVEKGSILVKDSNEIPVEKTFHHRFSCSERHPGLCGTVHAAIYDMVIQFARNLEVRLHEPLLYKFILIQAVDEANRELEPVYFYVGRMRKRMFHAQVTHVLTRCVTCDGPAHSTNIRLSTRGPKRWAFVSLWTVAREFLEKGAKKVKVSHVTHASLVNGLVRTFGVVCDWEVWPGVFKRPPPPAAETLKVPLDGDKPKPKVAPALRRNGGGIKVAAMVLESSWIQSGSFFYVLPPPAPPPHGGRRGGGVEEQGWQRRKER